MLASRFAAIATSAAIIAAPAIAQVAQMQLDAILHEMKPNEVALRRSACAMGRAPKLAADARAAGIESPNASAWCVAVLTRSGKDGVLGYVHDPRSAQPTPAIAFDSGFVGGYLKGEALPVGHQLWQHCYPSLIVVLSNGRLTPTYAMLWARYLACALPVASVSPCARSPVTVWIWMRPAP